MIAVGSTKGPDYSQDSNHIEHWGGKKSFAFLDTLILYAKLNGMQMVCMRFKPFFRNSSNTGIQNRINVAKN